MRKALSTFALMFATLTLAACGGEDPVETDAGPVSCSVAQNADGETVLSCPDGTEAIVTNGTDGQDGQDGTNGTNGTDGQDGENGQDGVDGAPGADGNSCTAVDNGNGTYTVTCEDGTSFTVSDGADGEDGDDGVDGVDGADGQDGEDGADGLDGVGACDPDGTATLVVDTNEYFVEVFLNGDSLGTTNSCNPTVCSGNPVTATISTAVDNVISFEELPAFAAEEIVVPACSVADGATEQVTGYYQQVASILDVIDITYSPYLEEHMPFQVLDANGEDVPGSPFTGPQQVIGLPIGQYTVVPLPLTGYDNNQSPVSVFLGNLDYRAVLLSYQRNQDPIVTGAQIPQNFVKGDSPRPLTIHIDAGTVPSVTTSIIVRAFADNDDDYDDQGAGGDSGDISANQVLASMTLYDTNGNFVAGPVALEFVEPASSPLTNGVFDAESGEYYQGRFDAAILTPAYSRTSLLAEVQILNSIIGQTISFQLAVFPEDIQAQDTNVPPEALAIGGLPHNPPSNNPLFHTIDLMGRYSVYQYNLNPQQILLLGSNDNQVLTLLTTAEKEAFLNQRTTFVNDLSGDFGDEPEAVFAVDRVVFNYPSESGPTGSDGPLVNGQRSFGSIDHYTGKDNTSEAQLFVDLSSNLLLSGELLRFGMMNAGPTFNTSQTFQAVGALSSQTVYPDEITLGPLPVMVTRASRLVITPVNPPTEQLGTTNVELYKFQGTGEGVIENVDPSAAKVTFLLDVSMFGDEPEEDVYNFGFEVNGVELPSATITALGTDGCGTPASVNVTNAASGNGLQDACTTRAGVDDGSYKVEVTFNLEEVEVNTTSTFTLKASVAGAVTDDHIDTNVSAADEALELNRDCAVLECDFVWGDGSGALASGRGLGLDDLPTWELTK